MTTQASALCKFKGETMIWFIMLGPMDICFQVVSVVGKFGAQGMRKETKVKVAGSCLLSLLFHKRLLWTRQYTIVRSDKMASEERRWQNLLAKSSRCDIKLQLSLL